MEVQATAVQGLEPAGRSGASNVTLGQLPIQGAAPGADTKDVGGPVQVDSNAECRHGKKAKLY